jgi:hypothetical protein
MFKPEVWEIIYNRFKIDSSTEDTATIDKILGLMSKDLKWYPEMSAADWWTFYELGDLTTNDERIVAEMPLPKIGFWARLHHAYANNKIIFNNKDEREWYNEWIKPFDDPLSSDMPNAYTTEPRDYMHNARYYFDNEAPVEMMNQENFDMNNPAVLWEWRPPQIYWQAINKQEVI